MTCRVARSYHNPTQPIDLVSCCKCGSTHLEVFYTSKTLGRHLCPICAQSMVECGVVKELGPEPVRCLVPS
jgi:hypothetical protein